MSRNASRYTSKPVLTEFRSWRDLFASESIREDLTYRQVTPMHVWRARGAASTWASMTLAPHLDVSRVADGARCWLTIAPTPALSATLNRAGLVHIDGDHLSLQVIVRDDGNALVVLQYGRIIGDRWLALLDASTLPALVCEALDAYARDCA